VDVTRIAVLWALLVIAGPASTTSRPDPAASTRPAAATEPAAPATLTILTFNVNYANRNVARVVDLVRQSEADVVCLQETNRTLERALSLRLKKDYPSIRFRGAEGKYAAERFGFLSRQPLGEFRYLPGRDGIFGTWSTEVPFDGRPVQLVNVHLEPLRLAEARGIRDTWRIYRSAEEIHQQEIDRIDEWIRKDIPTVLAGDFNSLSTFSAPGFLKDKGFTDSFAAVTEDADQQPTWEWELPNHNLSARIDYIFHSPHFRTIDSRLVEEDTSDHDPVVSTLTWSDETNVASSRPAEAAP
jgi:endonuclease/exonuclease/phosphatase family metal-dependent hydrolase